tara:strand:- start:881 stop:3847 length:2967 start_codon:yes stop_codon:yes gene_type:complete
MCGFVTDVISDVFEGVVDIVEDVVGVVEDVVVGVVDTVVDVVDEVISWVVPQPEVPEFSEEFEEQQARGILVNKFTANSSIPVVYGTRKVGGNVVFVETSGTDNQYLYMAVVLSEGEIDSVQTLFVNNHQVTLSGSLTDGTQRTVTSADANFFDTENTNSLITVQAHLGTDSQTSSSLLGEVSSWTSNHRLQGLAYLALRFEWNAEKFGALPRVQATIKGRKVYNPNLDSTVTGGSGSHRADTSTTWEYSDNPILQLLDYLRNDRFGMGIANSYFDSNFADWQTATDVCDADITPVSGASAIDLLDSHIVVDTSRKAINNVKEFVKGSRSYLNFSSGKYNILVETTGSASITLTEDNIIGGITVQSKNKNSRYNRVIVTFVNPDKNFQTDTVQFPPVDETGLESADQHATMKTEDGELLLEGRFDYTMITNAHQAQEMAEIILRRSRSSLDISLRADGTALDLAVGDIVNVTHATPAFSAKPFRVQRISINADHTVSIQCSEHQDSFYTFGTQQALPTIPDTSLPNPFNVQAPTISVTDELRSRNEEAIAVLLVNVTATDLFITDFEVQAKKSTDSVFINLGRGSSSQFELVNVEDNAIYDVRARSVSSISRSVFVSTTHQVVGKTAPPQDVTNFSVNIIDTEAHLAWTPVTDLDLSHYRIRHAKETSGATYANSIDIADKVSRPANTVIVPAMTGTYFIKAVDKVGNSSENAVSTVAIIESIKGLNLVSTSTQSPSFSGTKTNMVVVDGSKLQLGTANLFDSVAGNFDDAGGLFDGGVGNVASSGTYEFDTHIDLGSVYTSRVTANMNVARISFVNSFDDATGNFDDRAGLFDGDPQEFDDTNTELLVATTEGDPSGSPTYTDFRKFFVGDYKARAFKFKLQMTSQKGTATQQVSGLSVTVDMPDRVVAEADVVSGTSTSGKAITFSPAFKSLQGVGISAQNLASGDFYAITNKSETGFTIEFFNSASATVSRTFDYVARGFGEIAS